ncbi:MAG: hypothetical protein V4538_15475 [Bacteroidota bacterium]
MKTTKKAVGKTPTKKVNDSIKKLVSELNFQRVVNQELMEKLNSTVKPDCKQGNSEVNLNSINSELLKSNENLYNLNNSITERICQLTGQSIISKDFGVKVEEGFIGNMLTNSQTVTKRTEELNELLTVLFKSL